MLIYWIAAALPWIVLGALIGGVANVVVWLIARRARQWGQRSTMPISLWVLPFVGALLAVLWAWATM